MELASDQLTIRIDPGRGADIRAIVDRASGVDVLYRTPWAGGACGNVGGDSWQRFMAGYPGGWQLLLPNGGDACVEHGAEWAFHGEACLVPWRVERSDRCSARLGVHLATAPLSVERTIVVDGPVLRIEEAVTNESLDPIEVMWSHHPAFGAPLLAAGSRLYTGARRLSADPVAPGNLLAPGSSHDWSAVTTGDGKRVDLSVVPDDGSPRTTLAYLAEFIEPYYAIVNPGLGLGFGLRWDDGLFPYAWLWQELRFDAGFPWFHRGYVMAVEPATTIPGHGIGYARTSGTAPLTLAGGERRGTVLEAVVFHDARSVVAIREGARVEFGQAVEEDQR